MIFLGKYKSLRLVLRPTVKQVEETETGKVAITHPPLVIEFEGGRFDTTKMFPMLNERFQCCDRHRLKNEQHLIDLIKKNDQFGILFSEYYEPSPVEMVKNEIQKAKDLAAKHGLDFGEVLNASVVSSVSAPVEQPTESLQQAEDDESDDSPEELDYDKMRLPELQEEFRKKFGIEPGKQTRAELIDALSSEE